MDVLHAFCARMLGDGEAAEAAVAEADAAAGRGDRVGGLVAAAAACRRLGEGATVVPEHSSPQGRDLAAAVASELRLACARLPERQREALALHDLLGLSYEDVARVVGVESTAVAPLLARARLRLRAELRGEQEAPTRCPERERALRTIALRQDGRPVTGADADWLLEHLGMCDSCGRAHAAMLEAAACYRAWR